MSYHMVRQFTAHLSSKHHKRDLSSSASLIGRYIFALMIYKGFSSTTPLEARCVLLFLCFVALRAKRYLAPSGVDE